LALQKQSQLFDQLKKNNHHCVVLDSNEILKAPEIVLKKLCAALEIPFYNSMLHWPAGPKKEDGVWAKHWYDNVHKSTGFEKQQTSNRALPDTLNSYIMKAKFITTSYFNIL
jgi:hypothetical protein